ncbi:MAG: hypothetical protein OEM52_09445 [bacterium]|nr:hypothetical protein [bacterium]
MSKSREYDRLLELARTRYRRVQQQQGDFHGGVWVSPDGKHLLINRLLPLDDRIELLKKLLESPSPSQDRTENNHEI